MLTYLLRRFVQAFFTLLIITMLCFILTRLSSDPMAQYANRQGLTQADRERIRHNLGLDRPIPVQYLSWLKLAAQGDLGNSFFSRQPVSTMIAQRLPMTLILMIVAETITILLSLFIGIISAVKKYTWIDNLATSLSFIGYSMPIFFVALGLMLIFAVQFKAWGLPFLPTGADIWNPKNPYQLARHLVLPVACLVIIQTAGYSRFIRSSILEVMSLDYIRTARAKGLEEQAVLFKHGLRNAALPFITIVGLDIPYLLAGALVTESVFAWPGMGRLFWEYAQRGDFPVVLGVLLLVSVAVVFFTILTDLAYTLVDPRIHLG